MEPRSLERGNKARVEEAEMFYRRFNGAAFSRTRKRASALYRDSHCFALQWSRVLSNAETSYTGDTLPQAEYASMEPRSLERGNSLCVRRLAPRHPHAICERSTDPCTEATVCVL